MGLKKIIIDYALSIGFDICGVAPPVSSIHRDYFLEWLKKGKEGTMEFLVKYKNLKINPQSIFPGTKSILVCGVNYYNGEIKRKSDIKISRYAMCRDYHRVLKKMLKKLFKFIKELYPEAEGRYFVDTGPTMEKELARLAGLGWIRKNTLIINKNIGSYIFLGEILMNIGLPFDYPQPDQCGKCTICIDACPTGALEAPYKLNASKCISYATVEHKGNIPTFFDGKMDNWIFGCDICQDVCPYNKNPSITKIGDFKIRGEILNLFSEDILKMDKDKFLDTFSGTPIMRIGLENLKRNVHYVKRGRHSR